MTETQSLPELFSLRGCVAAVSGGSSGIGREIALALAAAGAKVAVLGRRENLLQEAVAEINQQAGEEKSTWVYADMADLPSLSGVAQQVTKALGAPNIVVNAAGVNLRTSPDVLRSTKDITIESWRETMDINLAAPFFLSRTFVDGMKNGGAIINIGSMQSLRAGLGDMAYGASKGGVGQLTRVMAKAWGRAGVRANAILPGFFPTGITKVVFEDAKLAEGLAESTLLGRNGTMADISGAAVFLASPASAYITGTLLPIDGGFLAK